MVIQNGYKSFLALLIAFLTGLAIPVSTALQNVTIVIICLMAIFDPNLRAYIKLAFTNYFIIFCVTLYVIMLLWVFKSQAPHHDITKMLVKMRIFILSPLIFAYFSNQRYRVFMCYGFIVGALISLFVSLGMFLLHKPAFSATTGAWVGPVGDWAAFRYHTYHNYFLGIACLMLLASWLYYPNSLPKKTKWFIMLFFLLSAIDVFYLVEGRAGQAIIIGMLAVLLILWNIRKGVFFFLIIAAIAIPAILFTSKVVQTGIQRVQNDISSYNSGDPDTSVGLRLEFHKNSRELIAKSPIIGYGTGSFRYEYQKYTGFTGERATNHPHNDYYWLWIDLGILGMIDLVLIIISGIYYGLKASSPDGKFAVIIAFSYAIGALQGGFFTDNISSSAFIPLMCIFLSGITFKKLLTPLKD